MTVKWEKRNMKRCVNVGICLGLVFVMAGCGIKTRAYIDDRQRVDIQPTGNAGYLVGTPPPEATQVDKKTRKVFIVEFSKENEENPELERLAHDIESYDMVVNSETSYREQTTRSVSKKTVTQDELQIPLITDDDFYVSDQTDNQSDAAQVIDYVVEKNDTLQKISKKFYGSYSKWTKIYEANKDVIKDPNFLKPGTALKIHLGK